VFFWVDCCYERTLFFMLLLFSIEFHLLRFITLGLGVNPSGGLGWCHLWRHDGGGVGYFVFVSEFGLAEKLSGN